MAELKGYPNVAMVTFVQGTNTTKHYAFASYDSLKVGDHVLVDTTYGMNVAIVKEVIPTFEYEGTKVTKEVICVVDITAYNKRKEARLQREKLKKEMDKFVKQNQEIALYEMFAKQSPEMATMLEEYRKLADV